jgi:hypothetical protein
MLRNLRTNPISSAAKSLALGAFAFLFVGAVDAGEISGTQYPSPTQPSGVAPKVATPTGKADLQNMVSPPAQPTAPGQIIIVNPPPPTVKPPVSKPQSNLFRSAPNLSLSSSRPPVLLGSRVVPLQLDARRAVAAFGGSWTAVTSAPAGGLCNPLLLRDGSVIVHECGTSIWFKLTPSASGRYESGTWTQIASMPSGYGPQYNAAAVLSDGRVIIMGGEYNLNCPSPQEAWTSMGAIYDPAADAWTAVAPPSGAGWLNTAACGSANGGIGDAASAVLPNGAFLLSACCASPPVNALFNPTTLGWSATGAPNIYQDEQGYTNLPNGNILTIDVWNPPATQIYSASTGTWSAGAPTPVSLIDPTTCGKYEVGPAVTRPDGTVVAFGGNTGCTAPQADPTAIYNSSTNSWILGPNVPAVCGSTGIVSCDLADAPAALLPSGNILFAASSGFGNMPTHFFEFTSANGISQVSDPLFNASSSAAFYYNFLVLPTGQIFMTDFSNIAELYNPTGTAAAGWAATVNSVSSSLSPGNTYSLGGLQINGLSQGAAYGDDAQASTNYPIIKIANNASGHVFYARTLNSNTTSIALGAAATTNFQLEGLEQGPSTLSVLANGIASPGVALNVQRSLYAKAPDFNGDGKSDILWRGLTGGALAIWQMNGGTVTTVGGQIVTNDWMIAGVGDFNGDGKTDILWRHKDGSLAIWFMNGGAIASAAGLPAVDNNWTIVGVGDFNGDGKADILFRHVNGTTSVWLMNGATVTATAGLGQVDASWNIVGLGDFDGDGKSDILWRNANGVTAIWLMNGGVILSSVGGQQVPTGWTVVGTGDFNGDGKSDILWRYVDGTISIWEMNGGSIIASVGGQQIPNDWVVLGTGDFNGDGKSDILWRYIDGTVAIWEMNGGSILASVGGQPVPPAIWALIQ